MLEALFALFGALVGGIITVQYMYAADRRKFRSEVALDVVSYCDEIYHSIQVIHSIRDHIYRRDPVLAPETESEADYVEANKRLTILLTTSIPKAKLAIAYSEGDVLRNFNTLTEQFQGVASTLRTATRAAWAQEDREIHEKFSAVIDPMRTELENRLLSDVVPISIWKLLRNSPSK